MKLFSKKNICCFMIAICVVSFQNVKAAEEDVYYTNSNNVSFTKEEYDFFTAMYYEGYQDIVTPELFAMFEKDVMHPDLVVTKKYTQYVIPTTRGTIVSSQYKTLQISYAKLTRCNVSISLDWHASPSVRSYDVIGAYLRNVTRVGTPYTTVSAGGITTIENDLKTTDTGFGVSILLPSKDYIKIAQTFNTTTGGEVYASYQHAKSNVSHSDSKNYSIGIAGLGHVFDFDSSVWSKYDAMEGVNASC